MTEEGSYIAVRCGNCGAAFRARAWQEGMSCPTCRAGGVQPLPAPGGAVDYILADRSQGTTSADVMFAEWAKWCGYITTHQYDAAIHRQNSELQSGQRASPIHEVMVSLRFLDKQRAQGLLRFLAVRRPDRHDEDFATRLLQRREADPQAVERVRELQRRMSRKRNEVPPIAQLLVQKHVITEAQMLDVLHEQSADGMGSLELALSISEPPPKETLVGKFGRRMAKSPHGIRNAALIVVLVLVAWGAWAWQLREPPIMLYGKCSTCGGLVEIEWTALDWPAQCPRCGHKTVSYAVMCPNGHIFARTSPFSMEPCPECGADFGRPLTEEDLTRPQPRRRPAPLPLRRRSTKPEDALRF